MQERFTDSGFLHL